MNKKLNVHLKLSGMAALWGVSWVWGRVVAQSLPPVSASAMRFLLAGTALAAGLFLMGKFPKLKNLSPKQWLGLTISAFFGVFAYAVCFLTGLKHMPAGEAAVIISLNPVLIMLLSRLIFKETITALIGTGMAMAFAGSLICITRGNPLMLFQQKMGLGQMLILGCVLCWACYTIVGRFVLKGIDALTVTLATAWIGGIMLAITAVAAEPQPFAWVWQTSDTVWLSLIALAIGSTALAYVWFFEGVKVLGSGTAGAYITLVPVFGVLSSVAFLGEPLHFSLVSGGILAVCGMLVMYLGKCRR
ncbi:DMT family transporter [Neisseria sp. Dent CA1/247]|uniref:DMT family transporter n=1 Tax=Neisseria sp. Dent CA1/247 TaxID=2912675 RepID=UPI001FD125A0|nr:DMT family transporter [Neisseria sp. Dent CA1/247]UOO76788.1 DMT family transporter [Neisseria sp. Dent CA1/247]